MRPRESRLFKRSLSPQGQVQSVNSSLVRRPGARESLLSGRSGSLGARGWSGGSGRCPAGPCGGGGAAPPVGRGHLCRFAGPGGRRGGEPCARPVGSRADAPTAASPRSGPRDPHPEPGPETLAQIRARDSPLGCWSLMLGRSTSRPGPSPFCSARTVSKANVQIQPCFAVFQFAQTKLSQ